MAGRIDYDDDVVVVKNELGEIVYEGISDYDPHKREDWRYDNASGVYFVDHPEYGRFTREKVGAEMQSHKRVGSEVMSEQQFRSAMADLLNVRQEFNSAIDESYEIGDVSVSTMLGFEVVAGGLASAYFRLVDFGQEQGWFI